jgi:hypothetical protein
MSRRGRSDVVVVGGGVVGAACALATGLGDGACWQAASAVHRASRVKGRAARMVSIHGRKRCRSSGHCAF